MPRGQCGKAVFSNQFFKKLSMSTKVQLSLQVQKVTHVCALCFRRIGNKPGKGFRQMCTNTVHIFCGQFARFRLLPGSFASIFLPFYSIFCSSLLPFSISFPFQIFSDLFSELRMVCLSGPDLRRSHADKPVKICEEIVHQTDHQTALSTTCETTGQY